MRHPPVVALISLIFGFSAASAGCSCDPKTVVEEGLTGIDARFEIDPVVGITQIGLSAVFADASEDSAFEPVLAPDSEGGPLAEVENIVLLLPVELGGELLVLTAEGLIGGERVAFASAEVEIVEGELAPVLFVLEALGCGAGVPEGSPCDDGDFCTVGTTCDASGACSGGEPRCPSTVCATAACDSVAATCSYADLPAGTACGEGTICDGAGDCVSGCWIDGELRSPGESDDGLPCSQCVPVESTGEWTPVDPGGVCDDGDYCTAGSTCDEDGLCSGGEPWCVDTPCATAACDSQSRECTLDYELPGTVCATDSVCNDSGECLEGCWIEGSFFSSNEQSPDSPCLACLPAEATDAWSPVSLGDVCDDGDYCTEGSTCDGDGLCSGGEPWCLDTPCTSAVCDSVARECVSSNRAPGTVCDVDSICDDAGECLIGCWIDGAFRAPGEANPDNACEVCDPVQSTSEWSLLDLTSVFDTATAEASLEVPAGVFEIDVKAWGAGGGGGGGSSGQSGGSGGGGGFALGIIETLPGETLTVRVGGGGAGGIARGTPGDGGGGGGYSGVFRENTPLLVAAGGGGGGGAVDTVGGSDAGGGGGLEGIAGESSGGTTGGGGGTQALAGAGGTTGGGEGASLSGGNGGSERTTYPSAGGINGGGAGGEARTQGQQRPAGGGGGAGLFGGGGGGHSNSEAESGGGGGGGSSFVDGTDEGFESGAGRQPGNADDPDREGDTALGGAAGAQGQAGAAGAPGLVIIRIPGCE